MTAEKLQEEIQNLWNIVKRLETEYSEDNRRFTVDGHLLGSLGEVYTKEKFDLELLPNSEKIHDAKDKRGNFYQIKITQRDKIFLKTEPDNLIVIAIDEIGYPKIIYNGDGKTVWNLIKDKNQIHKSVSIKQLSDLMMK
jgi:hypothetical protein